MGGVTTAFVDSRGILHALFDGVETLTVLAGYVLYYGGTLALLVKVVHEAVVLTESR